MKRHILHRGLAGGSLATLLASGVAIAAPSSTTDGLSPFPSSLPARCQPLARVPSSARTSAPDMAAHVSVAMCMAETALAGVTPDATGAATGAAIDASVERLDAAIAPSISILDQVIRLGDPYFVLLAQNAEQDLYSGLVVRMRGADRGATAADPTLETRLLPWESKAHVAAEAVVDLSREHPELAKADAVMANIIRDDTALVGQVASN